MTFGNILSSVKTSSGLQAFCNIFLAQQQYLGFNLQLLIIYFSQAVSVKFWTGGSKEGTEQLARERKTLLPSGSVLGHKKAACYSLHKTQYSIDKCIQAYPALYKTQKMAATRGL